MRIVVTDDGIPLKSVLKLVATGCAVGVGVVFVPFMTLAVLVALAVEGVSRPIEMILAIFMLPAIIALQGVLVGLS